MAQNIPFLLDTGWILYIFEPDKQRSHLESVNKFKEQMETALKEAKVALVKSKDDMAKYMYYNQERTSALHYQPRDKVYLDAVRGSGHCRNSRQQHGSVRGHPQNLIPITKSDNSASTPATALYIPPHRRYIHYVKT